MTKREVLCVTVGFIMCTIAVVLINVTLPVQVRTQSANASDIVKSECPEPTLKGAYFERGVDKETGEVICGFTFYNSCPYSEGVSADDPMCEKAKPTPAQLERWYPEDTTEQIIEVNSCESK